MKCCNMGDLLVNIQWFNNPRSIHCVDRLIIRIYKALKPWCRMLKYSYSFEIWQATQKSSWQDIPTLSGTPSGGLYMNDPDADQNACQISEQS